jgi:hypothetical protein
MNKNKLLTELNSATEEKEKEKRRKKYYTYVEIFLKKKQKQNLQQAYYSLASEIKKT